MSSTIIISRKDLSPILNVSGFSPLHEESVLKLLQKGIWVSREEADRDKESKHPIAYVILIDREKNKVFSYQRPSSPEESLPGLWSVGVGGHINPGDRINGNLIKNASQREIREEVGKTKLQINWQGVINEDDDNRGNFHFACLSIAEISGEVTAISRSIKSGKMRSFEETLLMLEKGLFEPWSKIALKELIFR